MIKTGSKFLFGLATFGVIVAILYAGATGHHKIGVDTVLGPLTLGYKGYIGEHVGYTILMSLAATSTFLGIFLAALRDTDPEAEAQLLGLDTVPDAEPPVSPNYWPIVAAFSAGSVVLGLAVASALFVIGVVGLVICLIEWSVRAWSDRATGDPEVNRSIRNRFMNPVEIPVAAVLGIGITVLAVSRILLALPKLGSYLVFGLVPLLIFVVGTLIVLRPKMSQSLVAGLLLAGGIALLAGGVVAAVAGEHPHEEKKKSEGEGQGESGLAPLPAPGQYVITVGN